ncbi:AlbA family DNA-binding domain-containing protein [Larkinella arboricola]|uniref:Putative DNA-binding protein n=1 Tax=Larkinella arboricola TaxID=643671 RepID=A0A327WTK1_LARAB|nr:ATP-binding protein [Larkinella arboricola]RAJ94351.1 putative DNA-binding protein [Larkinella arboricola]
MRYNLAELIAQGEGTRLEFKSTIHTAYRIARTLTAFSNTSGGLLIVGVSDDGRVSGVESELHEMQKIEKATDFLIDPAISISYEVIQEAGRQVLLIDIPESEEKPHYAIDERGNRTIYVRAKDKSIPTNRLMLNSSSLPDSQLLQSTNVRNLIQVLRKTDFITAKQYAQLVNISEYRASKLLQQLTEQGLLMMIDKPRPVRFSLKITE